MNHKNKNTDSRPMSPHLQIYAWNISSLTSIIHRLTGVLLYFSIIAISWYVVLYTYQINSDEMMENCDCPMKIFLNYCFIAAAIIIICSLCYHFCNGIRHLFWDIGKGFDLKTARRNGFLVILISLILSALTIGFAAYFKFM